MILHPIIDLLKRIVVALPDYAGGGGELPEGITAIDGGEFIVPSATHASSYPITHSLGTTPNFYRIWSDDMPMESTSNNFILQDILSLVKSSLPTSARLTYMSSYDHGIYQSTSNVGTIPNNSVNDTQIMFNSSLSYLAGITYHWIAFV